MSSAPVPDHTPVISGRRGLLTLVGTFFINRVYDSIELLMKWPPTLALLRAVSALGMACWIAWHYLVRNNTRVHGKRHLRDLNGSVLYVARHTCLINGWSQGALLFFPRGFFDPSILPWYLADADNYNNANRFHNIASVLYKTIPVKKNGHGKRKDPHALRTGVKKHQAGESVFIFAEGGREVPGPNGELEILPFEDGVAVLARHVDWVVIITSEGEQDVQHYYKSWSDQPRVWFDWIGRKLLWWFWCEGRNKKVDIAASRPISREEIFHIVGSSHGQEARERIVKHLELMMRERTNFLRRYRKRTGRVNSPTPRP